MPPPAEIVVEKPDAVKASTLSPEAVQAPAPDAEAAAPSPPPQSVLAAPNGRAETPDPPFHSFAPAVMELFDPERHLPDHFHFHGGPSGASAPLPLAVAARVNPGLTLIPRPEDCRALWDRYPMLDNVRAHSEKVADLAHAVALLAEERGCAVNARAILAAGLLHDLGKTYTIRHGGNHAQLGASWAMRETGNGPVARAVLFHVHWPWDEAPLLEGDGDLFMVMAIIYADKRTRHDCYVSLNERFEDLLDRYGVNEYVRQRIALSHAQGKRIEAALSRRLGVNLDECIADCGRLVQRT